MSRATDIQDLVNRVRRLNKQIAAQSKAVHEAIHEGKSLTTIDRLITGDFNEGEELFGKGLKDYIRQQDDWLSQLEELTNKLK